MGNERKENRKENPKYTDKMGVCCSIIAEDLLWIAGIYKIKGKIKLY